MKKTGLRDLMDENRYRPSHLQEALLKNNVPGRWEGVSGKQNVYNLIDGKVMPKDGYVFIFLSNFLNKATDDILKLYSIRVEEKEKYQDGSEIDW